MASITKLPSGSWRAQVRRNGRYVSKTFKRRRDADEWTIDMERRIDRGESVSKSRPKHLNTLIDLVDLHISDMHESRKPLRRSKSYSLNKLKQDIGHTRINQIDRETIVEFGRMRAAEGAGPATIAMDISYLKTIMLHAKAVHGVHTPVEEVKLARIALNRLSARLARPISAARTAPGARAAAAGPDRHPIRNHTPIPARPGSAASRPSNASARRAAWPPMQCAMAIAAARVPSQAFPAMTGMTDVQEIDTPLWPESRTGDALPEGRTGLG